MVLVGADPEFFVRKNNAFISGHIFECGTKEIPLRTKHGAVQVDGLALEANIMPARSKDEFIQNTIGVIADLNEIVKTKGCEIVAQPTAVFTKKFMKTLPAKVRQLGCNPDYNAYTEGLNDAPDSRVLFRTGAGHLHVGWTKDKEQMDFKHFDACVHLVKQMDFFVGLRTLKFDDDNLRRELYGQAGAFRVKPYGVEYRVPSSAWCRSEVLMAEMYEAVLAAVDFAQKGEDLNKKYDGFAQTCINKNITNWDELNPEVAKEIGYASSIS